jgi:hypothetical protein
MGRLAFEECPDKITTAPNQATPTHRAEAVERNAEVGRHDAQTVLPNACAEIGYVADATWVDAVIAGEEYRYVPIDRRPADGTALDFASGLVHFLKHR